MGLTACIALAYFGAVKFSKFSSIHSSHEKQSNATTAAESNLTLSSLLETATTLPANAKTDHTINDHTNNDNADKDKEGNAHKTDQDAKPGQSSQSTQPSEHVQSSEHKANGSYKPPVPPMLPTTQPSTQPSTATPLSANDAKKRFDTGMEANAKGDLLAARADLNAALPGSLPTYETRKAREVLAAIADQTIFAPQQVTRNDPLVHKYTVKAGDTLAKIAKQHNISEDCLASLNKLTNKNVVRLNAMLKVVDGPFHVAVSKKDHLLHVYLQDVYVKSFPVALGIGGGTPTGLWRVINKLENPSWVDPQTGQRWHADDPANPIGEYWIGLEGLEGECVGQRGFGIHGTIDESTIGKDVSLGCVRLAANDIAFVYKLLVPGSSLVSISESID